MSKRIVIDAREFAHGRSTGIGRVLEGLTSVLTDMDVVAEIRLALSDPQDVPSRLKTIKKISCQKIPSTFLKSEKALTRLSQQNFELFISPYPKSPLFGCHCKAVHIIHDVLNITHPAYKNRPHAVFDRIRLKSVLRKADLIWFVSECSMEETKALTGFAGNNSKIRYNAISETFKPLRSSDERNILRKYNLQPGYILVIGNGSAHKNLGVLLNASDQFHRKLVLAGVSKKNMTYWKRKYPQARALWIGHVEEEDLPAVIGNAFCLAQPSTAEGFAYPPLEAMACGTPTVVSNIPVLVETTGENALLAHPTCASEWVVAFKSLENRQIYQKKRKDGLAWVNPFIGRNGWKGHRQDIENLIMNPSIS
jgi:glycosyltransferase involved in cell wall biosynthesis